MGNTLQKMHASKKSVPVTVERIDPASFIQNYAENKPLVVLHPHGDISSVLSLEQIGDAVVGVLAGYGDNVVICGNRQNSTWGVQFLHGSIMCDFEIRIYKVVKFGEANSHVLEVHRTDGDHWIVPHIFREMNTEIEKQLPAPLGCKEKASGGGVMVEEEALAGGDAMIEDAMVEDAMVEEEIFRSTIEEEKDFMKSVFDDMITGVCAHENGLQLIIGELPGHTELMHSMGIIGLLASIVYRHESKNICLLALVALECMVKFPPSAEKVQENITLCTILHSMSTDPEYHNSHYAILSTKILKALPVLAGDH